MDARYGRTWTSRFNLASLICIKNKKNGRH
jgi:hypothetical protein